MNEPTVEIYPPDGGTFWVRTEKFISGEWVTTLRTKSRYCNPIGAEVARFSQYALASNPAIERRIVDALNQAFASDERIT